MSDLPPLFEEDHSCPTCRLAYADLGVDRCLVLVEESTTALADLLPGLAEEALRRRPRPGVWSPVEYACHVRDVLLVELASAAYGFAEEVRAVPDDAWDRPVVRRPEEERTVRWLARQAAHECVHHLADVTAWVSPAPPRTSGAAAPPSPTAS
jgi:hypothetical protein